MAKIRHLTPPGFKRLTLDGGRVAYSPNTAVRDVHTLFLKDAGPIEYHDPGLDIIGHTRRGHHYYFKTDLKSAFDYVTYERLHAVVDGLGIDLRLLEPRDHFFHEQGEGGLIQGAPASPYLFEIYCRFGGLDFELGQYCEAAGLHCTRYVDDVLLSSDKRIGKRVGPSVRRVVGRYGFVLNDSKTKRVNTLEEPLEVLGYEIRGTRIDPKTKTMQKLYSSGYDADQRWSIRAWRKQVRRLNKKARE